MNLSSVAGVAERLLDQIYLHLGRHLSTPLKIGIAAFVLTNFLYCFPIYRNLFGYPDFSRMTEVYLLQMDLFHVDPVRFHDQEILIYRILIPLVGHLLHLPYVVTCLLPWAFELLFLMLLARLMMRYVPTPLAATSVLLISLNGAFQFINSVGFADAAAFCFMILCMNPAVNWLAALYFFLGSLVDERILFAAPAVIFFRNYVSRTQAGSRSILLRCVLDSGPYLLAMIVYAAYHHAVTVGYIGPGVRQAYQSDHFVRGLMLEPVHGWADWCSRVWFGLRWTFIPLIAAGILLWKDRMTFTAYLATLLFGTYMTMGYLDTSRGMGYLFPMVAASAITLYELASERRASRLLASALCLNILTPSYFFIGRMAYPLPLVLIRTLQLMRGH